MNFLEKELQKKKETEIIKEIKNKTKNIQTQRIDIGKIIEQELKEGSSKKEILDIIINSTNLSKNSINNMIEEYIFNSKYNSKLSIKEIKILNIYFLKNKLNEKEKKELLKNEEIINDIINNNKYLKEQNKKINHCFSLDEEGDILFKNTKEIIEKILERKIKNKSELFYFLLLDFYNNHN